MSEYWEKQGLYWQPLGGNNIDQISGHSYQYTDVVLDKSSQKKQISTIIVDIGKFDNYQALEVVGASAAVPDVRFLLLDSPYKAQALFLTHSHPDHLNGIPHYLKAGYVLPPLYGGKYTKMILDDLYIQYNISKEVQPKFNIISDGDIFHIGSLEIEVLSSSHTCFDSYGFVIKSKNATVYHSGDMKMDLSTYFRKPTNVKRLKELSAKIDYCVTDFYGVYEDGYAVKEVDTFKQLVKLIQNSKKNKIFLPVYPTHPEMYIIAFLAALKLKKNVIFFGNPDFYGYLAKIIEYGISFSELAKDRIKVIYTHNREEIKSLKNNYVVIGTYNHVSLNFDATSKDSFGIITAKTFFNPLKGQFNAHNIKFVSVDDYPVLQGFGHGFLKDIEDLHNVIPNAVYIPTHCPVFVTDYFRELAEFLKIKLIEQTPHNNEIYQLCKKKTLLIQKNFSLWLAVTYQNGRAFFTEVEQKPTSGEGFLKRTLSKKRCLAQFRAYLYKRKKELS